MYWSQYLTEVFRSIALELHETISALLNLPSNKKIKLTDWL